MCVKLPVFWTQGLCASGNSPQCCRVQVLQEPGFVPKLMLHVGFGPLVEWLGHVGTLGAFTAVHRSAGALKALMPYLSPLEKYRLRRLLDAAEYGSGCDYKL